MLAQVLQTISKLALSVLTIHQSVPMEEKATITLSLSAKSIIINRKGHGHFEKYSTCL